jgi:DNA-binding XRE family transcriptional regulator
MGEHSTSSAAGSLASCRSPSWSCGLPHRRVRLRFPRPSPISPQRQADPRPMHGSLTGSCVRIRPEVGVLCSARSGSAARREHLVRVVALPRGNRSAYVRALESPAMAAVQSQPEVGSLLRQWRERRRVTQLELALEAGISARHLSFVETGRSKPGREMLLQVLEQLKVPFREQNRLLLAAGHARHVRLDRGRRHRPRAA